MVTFSLFVRVSINIALSHEQECEQNCFHFGTYSILYCVIKSINMNDSYTRGSTYTAWFHTHRVVPHTPCGSTHTAWLHTHHVAPHTHHVIIKGLFCFDIPERTLQKFKNNEINQFQISNFSMRKYAYRVFFRFLNSKMMLRIQIGVFSVSRSVVFFRKLNNNRNNMCSSPSDDESKEKYDMMMLMMLDDDVDDVR